MLNVHGKDINGAITYHDEYRFRLIDAWGADVKKVIKDFASLPVDDTTGDPAEFTLTAVEVGAGDSTAVLSDGEMLLTTAANEDDGVNLQLKGESFKLENGKHVYFGIKAKVSDATETDLLVGLCITDTTLLGGLSDGIYFECLDGSTAISAVSEKDSTETTSSIGTMDTDYHVYEFEWTGSTLRCYFDGTEIILPQTNIPDDEYLTPSIVFLTGDVALKTSNISWLRCIQC